jgi:hypothetical protein
MTSPRQLVPEECFAEDRPIEIEHRFLVQTDWTKYFAGDLGIVTVLPEAGPTIESDQGESVAFEYACCGCLRSDG